jgi:hypothetical protein
MKKLQKVLTQSFLVMGVLSIALSSCKKKDPDPKGNNTPTTQQEVAKVLNGNNWQITSMVADKERTINGQTSKDWFSMFKSCRKDNLYTFSVVGNLVSVSINEGVTQCGNQEPSTVNQALLMYMSASDPKLLTGKSEVEPGSVRKLFDTSDSEDYVINQEWKFTELNEEQAKITIQILNEFPDVEFTTGLPSIQVEMKRIK